MLRKWVDSVLMGGVFRIGTLYEYRCYEHKEIGDEFEGTKQFILPMDLSRRREAVAQILSSRPYLVDSTLANNYGEPLETVLKEYIPTGIEEHSPDCYVFCLTSVFDKTVMQQFGYDACIEISKPEQFLTTLSKSMNRFAKFAGLRTCQYGERTFDYDSSNLIAPQILKPAALQHQREVRLVWDPRGPKQELPYASALKPIFIKQNSARRYCRRII